MSTRMIGANLHAYVVRLRLPVFAPTLRTSYLAGSGHR
jgi:hypothetical protein